MRKIILASKSPRRKQLLEMIGLEFEVAASDINEDLKENLPPDEFVKKLSLLKAEDIAKRFPNSIIISADTVIVLENKTIGKPKDEKHAKEILKNCSGNTHKVLTGFTILDSSNSNVVSKSVETKVTFRKMSDVEIESYIASGEPLDKAGGYAVQGIGSVFVEKIEGDFFNVVGLPVYNVAEELKKFGIYVL